MRKNQTFWLFVLGLFAVFAIVALRQDTAETKPRGAEAQTPLAISASDLYDAYDRNEVAAADRYNGRKLAVTGRVERIAIDRDGTPYVDLDASGAGAVRANFTKGTEGVNRLQKDATIGVTCVGVGKGMLFVVHLKDCRLN